VAGLISRKHRGFAALDHCLDTIDCGKLIGLRDRALIGLMAFSFARVGAANTLRVGDYFENEKRWWLRLHEKGGKRHEVPCHHILRKYLDDWIDAAGIGGDKKDWLFRSVGKGDRPTKNRMDTNDVLRMIKRRAREADLPYSTCCHTSARPASPLI
jgi:integrase/recombinase XerD